jgi:hypothetical protein
MAQTFWHIARYDKGSTALSWEGEFADFAQALEYATAALGSGKVESIRFTAPDGATEAQIRQMVALGTEDLTTEH